MAVGRHRAVQANGSDAGGDGGAGPTGSGPAAANHELLGWGIFLAVTAAAAMGWAGIGWPVITGCALLLLVSFITVWRVQRDTGHNPRPTVAVLEPAAAAPPAPAATGGADDGAGSAAGSAGTGPAAGSADSGDLAPLTRKQMRAADPTTGLLPVVPMFGRAVPTAPASVQKGLETVVPGGRRERRHAGTTPAAGSQTPTAAAVSPTPPGPAGPIRPGTVAGAGTGSRFGPVIIEATVYGPAPQPAVPGPAAGESSPEASPASGDALAVAGESRWTRTFGPPETGQLPIQRYVAGSAASDPADPDLPDRRQRSHSSL